MSNVAAANTPFLINCCFVKNYLTIYLDLPCQTVSLTIIMASSIHVSSHPCVRAKLSQLRSASTNARDTKTLVHEIATIVGVEALAKGLEVENVGTVSPTTSCSASTG